MTAFITEFSYDSALEFLRSQQDKMSYDPETQHFRVDVGGYPLKDIFLAAFDAVINKSPDNELGNKISDISAGYKDGQPHPDAHPDREFGGYRWKHEETRDLLHSLRKAPVSVDLMDVARDHFHLNRGEVMAEILYKAGLTTIRGFKEFELQEKGKKIILRRHYEGLNKYNVFTMEPDAKYMPAFGGDIFLQSEEAYNAFLQLTASNRAELVGEARILKEYLAATKKGQKYTIPEESLVSKIVSAELGERSDIQLRNLGDVMSLLQKKQKGNEKIVFENWIESYPDIKLDGKAFSYSTHKIITSGKRGNISIVLANNETGEVMVADIPNGSLQAVNKASRSKEAVFGAMQDLVCNTAFTTFSCLIATPKNANIEGIKQFMQSIGQQYEVRAYDARSVKLSYNAHKGGEINIALNGADNTETFVPFEGKVPPRFQRREVEGRLLQELKSLTKGRESGDLPGGFILHLRKAINCSRKNGAWYNTVEEHIGKFAAERQKADGKVSAPEVLFRKIVGGNYSRFMLEQKEKYSESMIAAKATPEAVFELFKAEAASLAEAVNSYQRSTVKHRSAA